MATQKIQTRIKNRFDSLTNWSSNDVTLLQGEIALVSVTTVKEQSDGNIVEIPAVLMKVGENGADGQPKLFNDLPWLSASAADVYDWAKLQDPSNVTVQYNKGTVANPTWQSATLADILKDLKTTVADVAALDANKLSDITVHQTGAGSVVKSVIKSGVGAISVNSGTIGTSDIADAAVTADKVSVNAVTTMKIQDAAVTNAKVGDDISASKIVYSGSGASKITVAAKLADLSSLVANIAGTLSVSPSSPTTAGVVQGITYDSTTGKFTVSYDTVATADIANAAITTDKLADGNVTTVKIKDAAITNVKISEGVSSDKITVKDTSDTLTKKLKNIDAALASINTSIANGVHFLGVTSTDVASSANKEKPEVVIDGKIVTAEVGDIVIYDKTGREFIWDKEKWEELGDATRVGSLETHVNSLITGAGGANQFVSKIEQSTSTGKITVSYERPTSENVLHTETTTVKETLNNLAADLASHDHPVYTNQNAFSNIKVGAITVAADTANDTVEFAGSNVTITADADAANDKITFTVVDGATNTPGVVALSDAIDSTLNAASGKTAATPAAVKSANDLAKKAVADAAGALAAAQHEHPYLLNTTQYAAGATQNGAAVSANKVNAALTFNSTGGAAAGTTFDGSAAKTISYETIGASPVGHTHPDYAGDIAAIESNYVRCEENKLYVGSTGKDVIIFDCGGAEDLK